MEHTRPYWHVDAKWITGIISFFIISNLLFTIALFRVTSEKTAVPLMGKLIAYMYSRNGLDDQSEIDKFKVKVAQSPNGQLQPIPNLNVFVTQADIQGKNPRELRLWLFNQVASPIYEQKGVDKPLAKFGLLAFVSENTHKNIIWTIVFQSIFLLIFGSLFVIFSAGFGRIFGVGLLLFLTSVFSTGFWGILNLVSGKLHIDTIPFMGSGSTGIAKQISGAFQFVVPDIVKVFYNTYLWAMLIGIGIMITAGIAKAIFGNKSKSTEKTA